MTYEEWIEQNKKLIEKRVGKFVHVWAKKGGPYSSDIQYGEMSIGVRFNTGAIFWFSVNRVEFEKNNYHQRRRLMKIRREDMIRQIEDFANEVLKTTKRLK